MFLERTPKSFDTSLLGVALEWEVDRAVVGAVQFVVREGAWGTTVITLERSNNGIDFVAFATAVTVSAAGFCVDLDVSTCSHVRAVVTTAAASATRIEAFPMFKGYP